MTQRVLGAIRDIACAHEDGRVLVVSHGGPIRAIHAAALASTSTSIADSGRSSRTRACRPSVTSQGALTELCPATEIDALIERDQDERLAAAAQPPTPAG